MKFNLSDALHVLRGTKTAMDNEIPLLILETFSASYQAKRAQNAITITTNHKIMSEESSNHDLAKSRLLRTKAYLTSLVPFFVAVGASLEEARLAAQVGSEERKRYQDQIDKLTANANELESLIGDTAAATDAADVADDPILPTDVDTTPKDVGSTPPGGGTPPGDPVIPTGDAGTPPADGGGAIATAEGTGPVTPV